MTDHRHINQLGLDLIKHFEGWRNQAYQDVAGHWTIGYGHLIRQSEMDSLVGPVITREEGEALLKKDLANAEGVVTHLLDGTQVDDNEFAALVSFAYNLGVAALQNSTLLRLLKLGPNRVAAANEFVKWVYANHRIWDGLVLRRHAEKALFQNEVELMTAIMTGDLTFVEHYLENRPTYFRREQLLSALED